MSNSILYHTFGVTSVQHISTVFLTARLLFAAQFMPIISSAKTVNLVTSSDLARLYELLKCYLSAIIKSNFPLISPGFNAKNVVL